MRDVWYPRYTSPSGRVRSRTGGVPDHLPPTWPCCAYTGRPLGFLFQVYASEVLATLPPDVLCLQFYQSLDNYTPSEPPGEINPTVVAVPHGAAANIARSGVANSAIRELDIIWQASKEPDWMDDSTSLPYDAWGTKLGGAAIDADHFQSGEHVGFLGEGEEGFNFGGQLLLLVRGDGKYAVELLSD